MTPMTNKTLATALLAVAVLATACGDSKVQDITGPIASSRVRFFNFGVNAPSVNFYAGSAKVTATASTTGTEATTGVSYGAVGSGGNYSTLAAGAYDLTGKIAATTDKDLTVARVSTTLADGKAYSMYVSGFYDTGAKSVEAFVVEDAIPATIDWGTASVRFVNAISNSNPMTLYAKNTTTTTEVPVGGLVAYKAAGAFTTIPAGVYDLGARVSGASTNAVGRTAVSFLAGRVYTVGARGDITITSTTATNRPFLDNTANR
jgi:hypothetical protein